MINVYTINNKCLCFTKKNSNLDIIIKLACEATGVELLKVWLLTLPPISSKNKLNLPSLDKYDIANSILSF